MTQNQINFARLKEEQRHNLETEGYNVQSLAETQRHNVRSEDVQWYSAGEAGRHNLAQENLNWYTAQNQAQLQYFQGQQLQSQAYLNDVKAIYEPVQYELDKWFKENQVAINSVDAATRERAQRAAEREIDAKITSLLDTLGLNKEKWETEKSQVISSAVSNYAKAGRTVIDVAKIIASLLA